MEFEFKIIECESGKKIIEIYPWDGKRKLTIPGIMSVDPSENSKEDLIYCIGRL